MSNRSRGGSGSARPAAVSRIRPISAIQRRRNRRRAESSTGSGASAAAGNRAGSAARRRRCIACSSARRLGGPSALMIEARTAPSRQYPAPAVAAGRNRSSRRALRRESVHRPAGRWPAPQCRATSGIMRGARAGAAARRCAAPVLSRRRAACRRRRPGRAAGASPRCGGNYRRSRSARGGSLAGSLRMICWRPAKLRATDNSSKARAAKIPRAHWCRKLAPMSRHDWFCGAANGTGNAGAASETDLSNGDPANGDPDCCGTPSQSRLPAVPEAGTSTGRRTTSLLDWHGSAPRCPEFRLPGSRWR